MRKIGTMIVSETQWGITGGQVADIEQTAFGPRHVVLMFSGEFEKIDQINDENHKGIGWRIATPTDTARARRYAAVSENSR